MNNMQILAMDRTGETGEVIFRTPCSLGSGGGEVVVTDAMVTAYLKAQRAVVERVDLEWGRGGKAPEFLHPVREACRAGLAAAIAAATEGAAS